MNGSSAAQSIATEPVMTAAPPLSSKALGKRRETDRKPRNASNRVSKLVEEKRVTRSATDDVEGANDGPALHLPPKTMILLSASASQSNLVYFPPLSLEESGSTPGLLQKPAWRLLGVGDSWGRSRHVGAAETADTNDAFYHRLHRYPEILEKRSAKVERERLIHERSKLILEIEEMKGRGWVYHGAQGGKGEEQRRQKLAEAEERLQRYDALLPNQPRKSGFLNGPSTSAANLHPESASSSRANSPAIARREPNRHSTPVSASGDGGTTIKIVFKGSRATNGAGLAKGKSSVRAGGAKGALRHAGGRTYADLADDEIDADQYSDHDFLDPKLKKGKANRNGQTQKKSRAFVGMMARDSDDEEVDCDESEDEEDQMENGRRKRNKPNPTRLLNTFFQSEILRESVAVASKTNRKRSSRLAYAFGHRLPDAASVRKVFEPVGGISDDDQEPLEDFVRTREGCNIGGGGSTKVIISGILIPASALDVLSNGPSKVEEVRSL